MNVRKVIVQFSAKAVGDYHYLVTPDGRVTAGRPETRVSLFRTLLVLCVGEDTIARAKSLRSIVQALVSKYQIEKHALVGYSL